MSSSRAVRSAVKEIRFLFCGRSQESSGLKSFVQSKYSLWKKDNPKLPLLLRECQGTNARIAVRLEKGEEQWLSVSGKNATEIEKELEKVAL